MSTARCRIRRHVSFAVLTAVCVGGFLGCGVRSIPELVPVRGRLTLDGKPLAAKSVVFSPEEGTPGNGSQGQTQTDGSFDLVAVIGGSVKIVKGARLGHYRVTVSDVEEFREDGTPLPPASGRATSRIPDKYLSAATSPLRVEVIKDMPDVLLDMKSK